MEQLVLLCKALMCNFMDYFSALSVFRFLSRAISAAEACRMLSNIGVYALIVKLGAGRPARHLHEALLDVVRPQVGSV